MRFLRDSRSDIKPELLALAGAGVDVWCRGGMPSDYSRLAMCGLAGIAGGFVAGGVQRALRPVGLPLVRR